MRSRRIGAADGCAVLVALELGPLDAVEEIPCVQVVVAMELVRGAVEFVAAGLRQGVDLAARVSSELRAIGVRLNPELAYGLRRRAPCRPPSPPVRS